LETSTGTDLLRVMISKSKNFSPIFDRSGYVRSRRMASMQVAVAESRPGRMSGAEFRAFQEKRPDHERWELLGGVAMMMTPPTITHNRIAGNLERLLNDRLERHTPSLLATQRPGLELGSGD
jgi:Putative restriction endonuclease